MWNVKYEDSSLLRAKRSDKNSKRKYRLPLSVHATHFHVITNYNKKMYLNLRFLSSSQEYLQKESFASILSYKNWQKPIVSYMHHNDVGRRTTYGKDTKCWGLASGSDLSILRPSLN